MKILAIDSSSLVASVAVVEDDIMLAEYTVNFKKTHSQTLLPMIKAITDMIELDLNTIDAIAVSAGPGSFTGLRIGSATAKGLGLALNKPLIPVPTTAGMAYNFYGVDEETVICPIMDARRQQVYTGLYSFKGEKFITIWTQEATDISNLLNRLNELGKKVVFIGDGVPVFKDIITENSNVPVTFAPAHMNRQRAGALGVLAARLYEQGVAETAAEHKPDYLRKSQAERELAEKNGEVDN